MRRFYQTFYLCAFFSLLFQGVYCASYQDKDVTELLRSLTTEFQVAMESKSGPDRVEMLAVKIDDILALNEISDTILLSDVHFLEGTLLLNNGRYTPGT